MPFVIAATLNGGQGFADFDDFGVTGHDVLQRGQVRLQTFAGNKIQPGSGCFLQAFCRGFEVMRIAGLADQVDHFDPIPPDPFHHVREQGMQCYGLHLRRQRTDGEQHQKEDFHVLATYSGVFTFAIG